MTKETNTVTYQFEAPKTLWEEWKTTVPRGKSLDKRLIELIDADRQGILSDTKRVRHETTPQDTPSPVDRPDRDTYPSTKPDVLEAVDLPASVDPDEAAEAVFAARDYLEEHGPASMRDIVTDVMPDYPLGYDVPQLETGERFRGAWWRRIVKPGLQAVPEVEYRDGHNDYAAK